LAAASRTACSMNSTKRIQRSCLTHFNVPSCGTWRYRPRRRGDPSSFLSGRDRARTCRGVQMRMHYSTHLQLKFLRSAVRCRVGAHIVSHATRKTIRWQEKVDENYIQEWPLLSVYIYSENASISSFSWGHGYRVQGKRCQFLGLIWRSAKRAVFVDWLSIMSSAISALEHSSFSMSYMTTVQKTVLYCTPSMPSVALDRVQPRSVLPRNL